MTKKLFILCALALVSCSTANNIPLDDAYFWPDKKAQAVQTAQTQQPTQTVQTAPVVQTTKSAPSMEIISQKDTTITVRIKK